MMTGSTDELMAQLERVSRELDALREAANDANAILLIAHRGTKKRGTSIGVPATHEAITKAMARLSSALGDS